MSGLDLTGAYLKGVSLCRFVEGDGYYQRNLTDCTEQRWMDHGWVACSGNDLVNEPAAESPYEKGFCNLNQKVERRGTGRW